MTVRAVILGLVVAVGLATYGSICDLWTQYAGIGGDLVPNYAFGLVLIGLLLVNPFLRLVRLGRFKSAEWVVILSMAFMGSVIAGSGLMWTFPHPIIVPIRAQAENPGWKAKDLLGYVPDVMLVDAKPTPEDPLPDAVKDFLKGKARRGRVIGLGEVPWRAWGPTLSFWFAVLGLTFVAGLCAVVVVHRQWSRREHLPYPIVTFANVLIEDPGPGLFGPVFRQKVFWLGFALSFVILTINGVHKWYPGFPAVATGINFNPFREVEVVKPLIKVPLYGRNILNVQFFFAAVGLAYFVSSEVSFSLGISGWLFALCAAPLVARGVDMSSATFAGGLPLYMYFGAYLGMGIMVMYLGRRFYWSVLKRSLFLPDSRAGVSATEAWAARVGIAACILLVVLLCRIGLHPALAVAFVLMIGLLFMMVGRVHVATGLFIIQQMWHPVDILVGIFGAAALGPHALIILALLCIVVTIDTRIAVVPLALNVLRLGDLQNARAGRLVGWMAVAVIAAMIVAVAATVWMQYSFGVEGMDSDNTRWAQVVAKFPFNMLNGQIDKLTEAQLEAASRPLTLSRLLQARPTRHFFTAAGIGLFLVLGCSYLRLRFPRWPLHPVMFLVWGTPWMVEYAPCFLMAWLIKSLVLKYGGRRTYQNSRTFFVGLIVGEVAAAMVWVAVPVLYYIGTGTFGESYSVRP